ncbi:TetR family transcriptional regulator [Nocardia neocaledoniensis NBRC 108232]|uniref:TetR family transcriptional regulator n=1 Tax=Nocardia neocaledoniensis TaxID=236511 RepID=A0A317N0W2_9NOCA|nr:TetR/AcrR family transcriptional regulator [Nocardia neocaledoniensis]PWV67560.1 TetR family transcriptional regulator [Nocardia neocaledoniensis]GEM31258.1 TetR family transcriptional regulator [Nocardia neocaledoniensis NBRC 108232]
MPRSSTASTRPARGLSKSAATRRRVIDAAARLLVTHGYSGTRLSDVADEAGLQAGSLYYHFSSKEALVEEVLRYGIQFTHGQVRVVVDQLPENATPGQRLAAAVDGFVAAILELGYMSPAYIRSYRQLPAEIQDRLRPIRQAFGRLWEELIDAAIDSGELRSDIDPYVLRLFIVHTLEQVPEWPEKTRRSITDISATMRTLLFAGVAGDHPRS